MSVPTYELTTSLTDNGGLANVTIWEDERPLSHVLLTRAEMLRHIIQCGEVYNQLPDD